MDSNNKIQLLYGGANVPFHLRTKKENEIAAQEIVARAKEKAFSRGFPIIWGEKGKVVAEYANGKKFLVINNEITEIEYVK
jgi:hypothetical protein